MLKADVLSTITTWTEWANKPENRRFDIALFKIWIKFEKYLSDLFVAYAIGESSEDGHTPTRKLNFIDESHLNAFLRVEGHKYIDYLAQIKKLSKHIFQTDPFEILVTDAPTSTAYSQIITIRNYIAHESGESKEKLIRVCFGGNEAHFKEPNDFLLTKESSTHKTYYTYYTEMIKNTVELLSNPHS